MKTENHSIDYILAINATSFFIPPFQRAYAWGKPEIERYFSDILRIIESELDTKQYDKLEHFFGSVVIKEEKAGFANKSVVVDGQQRLTTTLLFLIALRDLEPNEANKDFITQNYLKNNASSFEDKIKLKQVTKDWEAYRALVNGETPKPGIIANAYQLFKNLIAKYNNNPNIKFEHYITAIQRMNVAIIFLDERPHKGEDPQIIFETLNSLGKPLSLSDLIRNYVLLNMNSDKQSDIYEKTWHPRIENVLTENTSYFFRDYLQYKSASSIKAVSDNNTKELYQQFKNYVEENFANHIDFIKDIVQYVNWYNWIISEIVTDSISLDQKKNKDITELLRNIFHDIKAEAFKPFVLGLLRYHQHCDDDVTLNDDQLISTLQTIRTYLIRRRIIGLTQGENKSIVLLSGRIKDIANNDVTMLQLLSNLFYKMRFPNDNEIKRELANMNFYEEAKNYSKFILGKIEEFNTKVAVDFRNTKITIEHIMPQKLNASWEAELGNNFIEIHNLYLHNIGNLILTEFNSEMGNKSFIEKREKLKQSSLNFRLPIIDRDSWNETSIQNHQTEMINWFLKAFSLPLDYQTTENWNTKIIESNIFSPLDIDSGDIAQGNKPIELHIGKNIITTKTWQDVFIKFIYYFYENHKNDFDFIYDNQTELFNREDTIIKWGILKSLIDSKIDSSNHYKTFEGKSWNKVNELTDSLIFIHINISASYCMSRMSNIMSKLNLSEEFVRIVLK